MTPDSLENWSTSLAPEKAWASLNQNCEGEGALGGAAPQLNCSLVLLINVMHLIESRWDGLTFSFHFLAVSVIPAVTLTTDVCYAILITAKRTKI